MQNCWITAGKLNAVAQFSTYLLLLSRLRLEHGLNKVKSALEQSLF